MRDNCPKVSIGLLTYNHEPFIKECLDSIRNQTYPNIELFISDDHSTDNTASIIRQYNEDYPGFISGFHVQNQNGGISKNCNFLLEKFTGKYGHIFSGDDIMLPEKTKLQVDALEKRPDAALCFSNIEWFWSDTNKKICNHFGLLQRPSLSLKKIIADFSVPTPSYLVNLSKAGDIRYAHDLLFVNDGLYIIEVLLCGSAVYLDKVMVRYRKHKASLTMQNYFYEDRCRLMALLRQKLPSEYNDSLRAYGKIVEYARIMELIQLQQKKDALSHVPQVFPQAILTRKWLARLGLIFYKMVT